MEQNEIVASVRKELKKHIDIGYRDGERKFFKEPIKNIGVRLPQRRQVAQKLWPRVAHLTKPQLFKVCEKLFSGFSEETTVASAWLWRSRQKLEAKDFEQFEIWVDKYLDNWAKVDDFCTHVLGYLINHFPRLAPKVFSWTKSKNRWFKRAAAVSLIYPWGKPKKYLDQIFKTALALLEDKDDLIQKGYGWMLKEASNHDQAEVFRFVMKHKIKMPRTALRYAIEKFPLKLKQQAMKA
ncbi:hypothetical protein A3E73_02130 [Candidatus Beckwithbacteria bacterium RIFCSPHIGHO2_12_FULL_47_17]|uniref:DNA alkylation repair protein n=1 Tax=Candidatus Beckwithbacteria bacterium RIFCSPHIGHO2_12_FULL_47_17 TaxID=1797460 RepID=A0A1F5DP65_9BACT|nr:MAG: hypothetical protein A3E73_02130 [Candidatus Beckwithbacteria bacterium RIFCSPHIGHO2_12_FULL_47_17]